VGSPQKPPERRQRRRPTGSNARKLELAVLPQVGMDTPEPHEWLPVVRKEWEAYWGDQIARAVRDPDLPSLYRLFDFRDALARLMRLVNDDPVVEGSQGQPVANKLWAQVIALHKSILDLEDRFGLSLKAKVGVNAQVVDTAGKLEELSRKYAESDDDEDPRFATVEQPVSDG